MLPKCKNAFYDLGLYRLIPKDNNVSLAKEGSFNCLDDKLVWEWLGKLLFNSLIIPYSAELFLTFMTKILFVFDHSLAR